MCAKTQDNLRPVTSESCFAHKLPCSLPLTFIVGFLFLFVCCFSEGGGGGGALVVFFCFCCLFGGGGGGGGVKQELV